MNKMFSCADDCEMEIYYQGTGSIHLNYDDVPKVVKIYKGAYGSELVGEDLDNFHIGFSMDKANSEIYAIESLFLGKKTSIDILEPTGKNGITIHSEHIIMKRIPTPCIKYYGEQHAMSVLDLFKQLYDNKTIKFDSTNDGNIFVCRNNKDHTISNVSDFTRKCKYIRDESDKCFFN